MMVCKRKRGTLLLAWKPNVVLLRHLEVSHRGSHLCPCERERVERDRGRERERERERERGGNMACCIQTVVSPLVGAAVQPAGFLSKHSDMRGGSELCKSSGWWGHKGEAWCRRSGKQRQCMRMRARAGAGAGSGREEMEDKSSSSSSSSKSVDTSPSWAKPGNEDLAPWAKAGGGGAQKATLDPQSVDLPFGVWLLSSVIIAIAAVGSIFEYANRNAVFGVIPPDNPLWAPILAFFAITGIPLAGFLLVKAINSANKASEQADKDDGYM
eukprot:TRINITY_DN2411_c3_g1_i1.p1 TRINITY_DN2411_c3_g1~~TRINITY_DN2411_c3_g1_i1.p1  ORF type:complete len:270 (+),score=59.67 TRINITY_DN2411_c3_g1_i1:120-929(+)